MRESNEGLPDQRTITIPVGSRKEIKANPRPYEEGAGASPRQPRVLIVEDERLVAENTKETLESHGYHVVAIVAHGEDAIKRFAEYNPDVILMDVRLRGEMDGVQTALVIRQFAKEIPILFLTAHAQEGFPGLQTISPDNFSYVMKPYSEKDLLTSLDELLKKP